MSLNQRVQGSSPCAPTIEIKYLDHLRVVFPPDLGILGFTRASDIGRHPHSAHYWSSVSARNQKAFAKRVWDPSSRRNAIYPLLTSVGPCAHADLRRCGARGLRAHNTGAHCSDRDGGFSRAKTTQWTTAVRRYC